MSGFDTGRLRTEHGRPTPAEFLEAWFERKVVA